MGSLKFFTDYFQVFFCTCQLLFQFGTEPIKEFAFTLMIVGIQIFFSSFLLSILGLRRTS